VSERSENSDENEEVKSVSRNTSSYSSQSDEETSEQYLKRFNEAIVDPDKMRVGSIELETNIFKL
jgi:hypothetical protein